MNIGKRIKDAREFSHLTQKQIGDMIGVTAVTINRYEQNKREPKYEVLLKICEALNINILDIFYENTLTDELNLNSYLKLKDTHSIKELLKIAFSENEYINFRMEKSFSSSSDIDNFLTSLSTYIDMHLSVEELNTMPTIKDDDDGEL